MYSVQIDGFKTKEEVEQYIEWLSSDDVQRRFKMWWLWQGYGFTGFNPAITEVSEHMINNTVLITVDSSKGDLNA